jgi:regulator of protease activity HflC (stomatin/prohibitin superfamily)
MFGIRYLKAPPTAFVMQHKVGRVKRSGVGLSFFYYAPTSTIVSVPIGSTDVPFAFVETSRDYQSLTVQGQLTYRIADATHAAALLDYTLKPNGAYASDDPRKLDDRLVHTAQVIARGVIGRMGLHEALAQTDAIASELLHALRASETVTMMGLEILGLSLLAVRPTPDVAKALEAEAREALLRRSDEAIYARRNAAVEQERTIRENELRTDIAVEEKKRQIRETQVAADVAVEEQRSALIDRRVANERKEADAKAYTLEKSIEPLRELDWRKLMALAQGGGDPKVLIGMAFRDLAENAQKIGELNITPDLLAALTETTTRAPAKR